MNVLKRLRLVFARDIDEYFRKSRRLYVPVVAGGMYVDHDTAMSLAAVFGAVRYISESIASLPWELRQNEPNGGSKLATGHPAYRLIHTRPNPNMSSFDWRVLMSSWANLWGNAYSEIEFDVMNRPIALWPINPGRVKPRTNERGLLYYEITQKNTEKIILFPENMFHLRGIGDELEGYSVVSLAARSIGAGLAADEFSSAFYQNGAVTSGTIKHPKALGDKAYDRLKEEFAKKRQGPRNAWKPWILEEGMEWETMSMPLKDAQFLESRKFTVEEIARWFRVPPHKIAQLERATFSNIEHQAIEVVQDTIIPWALRLEQEADYKLISSRAQNAFFSKINVNGLLRGDSTARATFYKELRNMGAINANEIRALEDMNPIAKGGEKYVMQGQYTTLEKIGKEPEINPFQQQPQKKEEPLEEEDEQKTKASWRLVFYDALERVNARKEKRLVDAKGNMPEEKFESWLERFAQDHNKYYLETLRPVFLGYAKAVEINDPGALEKCLQDTAKRNSHEVGATKEDLWFEAQEIQIKIQDLKES